MQPDKTWPEELKEAMKGAYHAEFDIEAARKLHIPRDHPWHQQGPYIICESCKPAHSYFVGVDKNLKRNEEGEYYLENRFLK